MAMALFEANMAEFSVKDKKQLNNAANSINSKANDISNLYSTPD